MKIFSSWSAKTLAKSHTGGCEEVLDPSEVRTQEELEDVTAKQQGGVQCQKECYTELWTPNSWRGPTRRSKTKKISFRESA